MRHLRADELEIHRRIDLAQQVVLRHEFLERHHLEFVLRGHGRLQHHAIKKQKNPTWRGFVSNLKRPKGRFCHRELGWAAPAARCARAPPAEGGRHALNAIGMPACCVAYPVSAAKNSSPLRVSRHAPSTNR
ncbi:hypothetical protein BO06_1391 [Burkholderia mallei]|nr:hypothetical protein BO06_1391 [Burkholderia mallei]